MPERAPIRSWLTQAFICLATAATLAGIPLAAQSRLSTSSLRPSQLRLSNWPRTAHSPRRPLALPSRRRSRSAKGLGQLQLRRFLVAPARKRQTMVRSRLPGDERIWLVPPQRAGLRLSSCARAGTSADDDLLSGLSVDGHLCRLGAARCRPTSFPPPTGIIRLIPLSEPEAGQSPHHRFQIAIRVWNSPIWASYIGGGPSTDYVGDLMGDSGHIALANAHHKEHRRLLFVDRFAYTIVASIIVPASPSSASSFIPAQGAREYLWFAILLMAKALDAALTVINRGLRIPVSPHLRYLRRTASSLLPSRICALPNPHPQGPQELPLVRNSGRGSDQPWCFNVAYWPGWLSVGAGGA